MNIGFDAKRAFHNGTGLGHYSRTLVQSLSDYFPEHHYYLFNPKPANLFQLSAKNMHEVRPTNFAGKLFSSAWRSSWVKPDLKKLKIDLYHGLSHEIPWGIQRTGIKSVVTIHDLIYERFPAQYNPIDVKIYRRKIQYACAKADKIIAISEQTKRDIITYYKTPVEKIVVCYQSCNAAFRIPVSDEERKRVRALYDLPDNFFLYVGSIIDRKNLLNICKAMFLLRNDIDIPLVIIGEGGTYKQLVKDYIRQNDLGEKIIFLSENQTAKSSNSFKNAADFPAIYQCALAMIYPSFFEGFGIPVLEALCSGLPVITSNTSCLPEAAGPGAYYVDPSMASEIADGMKKIASDKSFVNQMKNDGYQHAQHFTTQQCAARVMEVYKSI